MLLALMRLLRRILITVVSTLGVIALGVYWVGPVALSFYAARKAPNVARVVPTNLGDLSVSHVTGKKLSYFGYEFEVPWIDLDETQTKLSPKENPCRAVLVFQSGLRLMVTAVPPREWARNLSEEMKVPPQNLETAFGEETMKSDYDFLKNLYEFTPDKMHHWSLSESTHSRESILLIIKSIAPMKSAETGIFRIQNQGFRGFQEGNPQVRQDSIAVHLLSNEGSVEFIFFQKDYQNAAGIGQPEINRVVQSLRKVPQSGSPTGS
jgi:hypothetical protein